MRKSMLSVFLVLLVGALAFATGDGEDGAAAGGAPVMDAFVISTGEWTDYGEENNRLVEYFQNEYGIVFDFIVAPEESQDDQKSLLLASGDYPSIFFHGNFSKPERQRYGRLGVLQPLNDLIEEYAPNVQNVLFSDEGYAAGTYAPDGNIYGLPGAEVCYHCFYTPKMWINYDWLETLGLEVPTTTDEFEAVLEAFKDGDPNGNGIADEIGFSGAQQSWYAEPRSVLLSPFLYVDIDHYLGVENGQIYLTATQDAFRDGLLWAAGLYEKGLIDPLAFTQDEDAFGTVAQNPDAAIVGSYAGGHQLIGFDINVTERWNQYFVLAPLEGPNGHRAATYRGPAYGAANFAVTNVATDEIARIAVEMQDWLFTTEGGLSAMWGPPGELWDYPEEGALGMRGQPAAFNTYFDRAVPGVVYGFEPPFYISLDTFLAWGQDQNMDIQAGYERRLTVATDVVAEFTPDEVVPTSFWMSDADADSYAQYLTEFKSFIDQNVVAFITGQQDVRTGWDDFQDDLMRLGLEDYLGLVQDAYDATN